ncbi:MAG: hypothetical protein GY771_16610 [bacterium]|nr:hypothetical protein [bacterium]
MSRLTCPNCGSAVEYSESAVSRSVKCDKCSTEILVADTSGKEMIALKCPSCGGEVKFVPGTNKVDCQFCGSDFMVPPDLVLSREGDMGGANYIASFTIDRRGVLTKTLEWLEKGFFVPEDADKLATIVKLDGRYVPVYIFECDAQSDWQGEYSVTKYRNVTRTRYNPATKRNESYQDSEGYKEWYHESGTHTGHYRFPISGAPSKFAQELAEKLADNVESYENDRGSVDANTFDAEGTLITAPAVSVEEAWRNGMGIVDEFERSACQKETERLNSCSTQVSNMTSRLYFQPVWDFTYKYKGKEYQATMDGRVGTVTGGRPVSRWKVIILVTIIVVVLIILALILCGVCGGGSICAGMGGYASALLDNATGYIA